MAAIVASSISTPGAITLELPGSSRWDTTTARRDFRATSSRGSRPYGAKARRDRPSARDAENPPQNVLSTSKISATRLARPPNMFDWRDPPGKSEWPNGDWEAAQGGHPRQEGGEGTAEETHAAEASAVHHCRLGARTRPGSGGGAPNRQRPHEQS